MRRYRTYLILTMFLLPGCLSAQALDISGLSDQTQLSILTAGPAEPLYTIFGHTAIRLKDPGQEIDIVYNYGTFDFKSDNFYLKFARGNLHYFLSKSRFEAFIRENRQLDRYVGEQVLNLSPAQIRHVARQLEKELLPENRYYRYEFFANNCVTKVRDLLGKQDLLGSCQLDKPSPQSNTYRQLLKPYLAHRPWIRLGINLTLGAPADIPANDWQRQFLPDPFSRSLAIADLSLLNQPLVSSNQTIVEGASKTDVTGWLTPGLVFWTLFLAVAGTTLYDLKNAKFRLWIDRLLFGFIGLFGAILMFLAIGSLHEPLHYNWNLLWAMPTHLIVAAGVNRLHVMAWFKYYLWAALIIDSALMASWFLIPQQLPEAVFPLILTLMVRLCYGIFTSHDRP